MATVSKEAVVAAAVVTTVAGLATAGYLYRERIQATSAYQTATAQASAAAAKSAEALKAVQDTAAASYSKVAAGVASGCSKVANTAHNTLADVKTYLKQAKCGRKLRRVRSFPVVAEEDDVAAGQDQRSKKASPKKVTKSPKKATEPEKMGVPVQVLAK